MATAAATIPEGLAGVRAVQELGEEVQDPWLPVEHAAEGDIGKP